MCGAATVLFDLDLAIADRLSRNHTIDLFHSIAKASWAYERAETEYKRDRVVRSLQQSLPAALAAFLRGQVSHREQSIRRVRSQVDTIRDHGLLEGAQLRGTSIADLESLCPIETSPEDVVARILEVVSPASFEQRRGAFLGLVDPHGSPRRVHVDPDRDLLGRIQDHLDAHGFSYGEIARLTPDGEGGTPQQQRGRVKNRLQHRRRER